MERRLAAILSYDLVGYSRAMGVDERGTLDRLKAHRRDLIDPMAARHGGRTIKLMGDGALMEFSSAVDAVSFAVVMQVATGEQDRGRREDQRMQFRIGINVGDVIVDGDDIYGDGVNVSARLEGLSEPGGVCIHRNVRDQICGKLDLDFKDRGEVEVKNIERPVRVFNVAMNDKATALAVALASETPRPARSGRQWRPGTGLAVIGIVAALAVAGAAIWRSSIPSPAPDEPAIAAEPVSAAPSVAVLPFKNLSNDPDQAYFVDGLTIDVTTDLGRFRSLRVASPSATAEFGSGPLNLREAGRKLGVEYILEGSVEKSGDRLRVTTLVTEVSSLTQIWTQRFDRQLTDLFAVRDEISRAIVGALTGYTGPISKAEQARATRAPEDRLSARELYYRAYAEFSKFDAEANTAARGLLERSISLDPEQLSAHWLLGWTYWRDIYIFGVGDREHALEAGLREARRCVALDPADSRGQWLLGAMLRLAKDNPAAAAAYEKAGSLNPNDPDMLADSAEFLSHTGDAKAAVKQLERAMVLNPSYPAWYRSVLQRAYYNAGEYRKVIDLGERMDEPAYYNLENVAASYAQLGEIEQARAVVKEVLALEPGRTIAKFAAENEWLDQDSLAHFVEALRKAGLPE